MHITTLCYIERDGNYLMLHRTKKEQDPNAGKWIGVGGKVEPGETLVQGVLREIHEETGLVIDECEYRAAIRFVSDCWDGKWIHLFTAETEETEIMPCSEGDLAWIPKDQVMRLPLWEGDCIFLRRLLASKRFFRLRLVYRGEKLVRAVFAESEKARLRRQRK